MNAKRLSVVGSTFGPSTAFSAIVFSPVSKLEGSARDRRGQAILSHPSVSEYPDLAQLGFRLDAVIVSFQQIHDADALFENTLGFARCGPKPFGAG